MQYKVGACNDCGACCYVYSQALKHFHICEFYSIKTVKHCTIYERRPKECRDFPRSPADLERVQKWCSVKFMDERGVAISPFMETGLKLTPISQSPNVTK